MDYKKVIQKIKTAFLVETNEELARALSISKSTVDAWSRKKEVPEEYIKKTVQLTGVNIDFLLSSETQSSLFVVNEGVGQINSHGRGQVIGNQYNQPQSKKDELIKKYSTPDRDIIQEFEKILSLLKFTNKYDYVIQELEKIKEELKKYI